MATEVKSTDNPKPVLSIANLKKPFLIAFLVFFTFILGLFIAPFTSEIIGGKMSPVFYLRLLAVSLPMALIISLTASVATVVLKKPSLAMLLALFFALPCFWLIWNRGFFSWVDILVMILLQFLPLCVTIVIARHKANNEKAQDEIAAMLENIQSD